MGRIVIAAYRPKPGRRVALAAVVARHWRVLHAEQLVTDRPRQLMQAADGTIIEVFEWRSLGAIELAHRNAAVQALWAEFGEQCEFLPLADLAEARGPFAEFEPLEL